MSVLVLIMSSPRYQNKQVVTADQHHSYLNFFFCAEAIIYHCALWQKCSQKLPWKISAIVILNAIAVICTMFDYIYWFTVAGSNPVDSGVFRNLSNI